MQNVEEYFKQELNFSDEDFEFLSSKMKRVEFSKKSEITKTGRVERHLSFLEEGVVRLYIPKEENDLTFAFVFRNSFVSAYSSFLSQNKTAEKQDDTRNSVQNGCYRSDGKTKGGQV